ncbi:MAG: DUF4491 family protein [Bacteroidales bacterium]
MNYQGILLGFISFLIIGLYHPLVIKAEYYFGVKSWWFFFLSGLIALVISLFIDSDFFSIITGVIGFSAFWSTFEVFKQQERVKLGRAKKNPRRNHE